MGLPGFRATPFLSFSPFFPSFFFHPRKKCQGVTSDTQHFCVSSKEIHGWFAHRRWPANSGTLLYGPFFTVPSAQLYPVPRDKTQMLRVGAAVVSFKTETLLLIWNSNVLAWDSRITAELWFSWAFLMMDKTKERDSFSQQERRHSVFQIFITFIDCVCVSIYTHACMPWHECQGQRTACGVGSLLPQYGSWGPMQPYFGYFHFVFLVNAFPISPISHIVTLFHLSKHFLFLREWVVSLYTSSCIKLTDLCLFAPPDLASLAFLSIDVFDGKKAFYLPTLALHFILSLCWVIQRYVYGPIKAQMGLRRQLLKETWQHARSKKKWHLLSTY